LTAVVVCHEFYASKVKPVVSPLLCGPSSGPVPLIVHFTSV
jgi:hypothetical protein